MLSMYQIPFKAAVRSQRRYPTATALPLASSEQTKVCFPFCRTSTHPRRLAPGSPQRAAP